MNKPVCYALIGALLCGCASYRPVVDMDGVDQKRFDVDLAACQRYAREVSPEGNAAAGAVIGALLGAAIGAAVGNRDIAKKVAGVGAISGGARGAAEGAQGQVTVIRNCMSGRGYKVLY